MIIDKNGKEITVGSQVIRLSTESTGYFGTDMDKRVGQAFTVKELVPAHNPRANRNREWRQEAAYLTMEEIKGVWFGGNFELV